MYVLWFSCVLVICANAQESTRPRKFVDLSHWLDSNSPTWPGHKPFNMTILELKGFGNLDGQAELLSMSTHFGTHIDAPIHIVKNRWTLDEIPTQNLQGPAVVINVRRKAEKHKNYAVTKADIRKFEKKNGKIPQRGIVLFNSGWGKKWNSREDFLGTATKNLSLLASPGIGRDAAEYLVQKRNIVGIGVDTISYDVGNSVTFDSHFVFSRANKWGLENVANLHKLPPVGCDVYVFPLKLRGASGAPARVVAFCPEKQEHLSGSLYKI